MSEFYCDNQAHDRGKCERQCCECMDTQADRESQDAELLKHLAAARQIAEEVGDADLIALTEMSLADAHHFLTKAEHGR